MTDEFDGSKVLVVDDDRDILFDIVKQIEEDLHLECLTARDGEDALKKFSEHRPALIVLDMMLPMRSGFLVMESLSKTTGKGQNPRKLPLIIMITANLGRRHQLFAEKIGTWRYLTKPFKFETLMDLIRRARDLVDKNTETR